jgi:Cyclopropane fatty acid synthase and related methyltransferases
VENYDALHKLWTRAHAAGSPIKFVRNSLVFKELDKLTPGKTLDAGCGTGEYSLFLSQRGHRITAFDPSPFAIKELLKMSNEERNISAEVNSIEGFCSPRLFDNIVSIEVFEHIECDHTAIQKLYSLLKQDGLMVISVPGTPFLYSKADKISGHYRRYSEDDFQNLLLTAGFKKIQIRRYGFPILFFYSLIRKLFLDRILLSYFTSPNSKGKKRKNIFSKLYPVLLIIDQFDIPLWSVGFVARCQK